MSVTCLNPGADWNGWSWQVTAGLLLALAVAVGVVVWRALHLRVPA